VLVLTRLLSHLSFALVRGAPNRDVMGWRIRY